MAKKQLTTIIQLSTALINNCIQQQDQTRTHASMCVGGVLFLSTFFSSV